MQINHSLVERSEDEIRDIPLARIGHRYERLRIVNPRADNAIYRSMATYGQFLPVVASGGDNDSVELIDGFKRLRAARALELPTLRVRVVCLGSRAGKAMLLQLNWQVRTISAIEESLTIHSLHREDSLNQVEIATLLGRHKSWVCRRLALVERLCDEALERVRLGLITVSICRELVRLPRGNQEAVLEAVCHHRLTCRETKRLVDTLIARPEQEHPAILAEPRCLETGIKNGSCGYSQPVMGLARSFPALEGHCRTVTAILAQMDIDAITDQDHQFLTERTGPVASCLEQTAGQLRWVMEVQP